ncbi:cupin domain-containing protein [Klebsiella pneumoniae]|uniref:cupin domain-containing protein n=1 Tax=Klebsiella TaxID=570 RepID=UPI0009BA073F|nr:MULTISPECIES: cupin domain-containing protein [Klebsiella]HBQ8815083.1 cupin domain-containing protein [Klebsiella quasipneumoniae]HCT4449921.1 cupin domain-containing protein [Klebsiella michiganensis]HDH1535412.1 cupin domain-containing protein [Klebsiella quasipneumoniae subsp. similipneumoniae]MBQ5019583.1 cupin domain-containing protein [Klebsiella pneumoniae]MBQ5042552.1 cupin domain-containing protein [Klebsiella pneumoniae]
MADMNRRCFMKMLSGAALTTPWLLEAAEKGHSAAASASASASAPVTGAFLLSPKEWVPNNPALPVLLYRQVIPGRATAQDAQQLFAKNGWPPQWVDGVFDYHHYHSTAHEVLGVVGGEARLMLGGPGGKELTVRTGDVVVLPAGTGHCNLGSSADFSVVGAYPPGQDFDLCRDAPTAQRLAAIASATFPHSDPVFGAQGLLLEQWL